MQIIRMQSIGGTIGEIFSLGRDEDIGIRGYRFEGGRSYSYFAFG
jgi:hypothetical protein